AGEDTPNIDFALTPMGEPGSISGTVTDSETGEPIPYAQVYAHGEFGYGQGITDSLGQYIIASLCPGYYFVTAWAWGYWAQDYPDTVGVIEGQNTPGIDFALIPHGGPGEGVIAGQVLDDTTFSPIPSGLVFAISLSGNWGIDFTDSTGSYMIEGLETDDYYLYALAPGYIGEFYDGVYTWEEATLVTPDAYDIDFYLGPCGFGGGRISGVISSDGSPLEGAFVYAEASGEVKGFARSSTEGGYVIGGLLPGTYTVSASKVWYHDGSYPDPVEIGSGKVSGVDIELPPIQVGDVTGDGSVNIVDVIFLINYLYMEGPVPDPLMTGDVNYDGSVNIIDVVYMINYLYKEGPSPCNP
ncbi:MAG: carboxypeptidase regulatory-like domain-containing protein, partial [candidate division Zixibacteria bacterium]|nr:carboxypeptidase regulatory-like domain-containing protein [candidate division Zixibacteria bacterium]